MTPATVAVIRPAALRANLDRVRVAAPGCPVLAVVKANAYGHGLVAVARVLDEADALAVARLEEAVQLREAGIARRLVVLGGCSTSGELASAASLGLDVVVHCAHQLRLLVSAAPDARVWCWLKVDTGMGRLGLQPEAAAAAITRLRACDSVSGLTLMTHLGCADDRSDPTTPDQLQAFDAVAGAWDGEISIANSAAIVQWPEALRAAPGRANWVRPGIMLYGASPLRTATAAELGLRPAMSFESRLVSVKIVRKGCRVGYGGHWVAPRDSLLAVVAAGYADGYPWHAAAGTPVLVRDQAAPLVGRVSMDMITVDVTDIPGAAIGDRVVLWGDSPGVEEVAAAARTIPWVLMTGINRRVAVRMDTDPAGPGAMRVGREAAPTAP